MTNLKFILERSGYRQQWVAIQAGIDPATLSRYVSGQRRITPKDRKNLAKILKVSQKDLEGEVDYDPSSQKN